jgi:hypothetical protein
MEDILKQNKKPKTNWSEYQFHEKEPAVDWQSYSSIAPYDGLFDHSPFLKRQVWRKMKKIEQEDKGNAHRLPRIHLTFHHA